MSTLRIGIVGCGQMAENHAQWIGRLDRAELLAVVDIDPAARGEFAERFSVPNGFGTIDELIEAQVVDVVHVVTPPRLHYEQVTQCIRGGLHVLVEKPFTYSADEARAIYALAHEHGVKVLPDFIQLFHPAFKKVQDAITAGKIGRVVSADLYFGLDLDNPAISGCWPVHWIYRLPGGILHTYITHPLYLVASVMEGPLHAEVTPRSSGRQPQGTTDHLVIQLEGPAADGTITIADTDAEAYVLTVRGTKGTVVADFTTHVFSEKIPQPGPRAIQRLLANPRLGWQLFWSTVGLVWRVARGKVIPYQGLGELFERFYASIDGADPPFSEELVVQVAELEETVVAESGPVSLATETIPGRQADVRRDEHVLVTGGAGYVGRVVVEHLVKQGYEVRALARPTSLVAPLQGMGVEIVYGDLRDATSLASALEGVDTLVHLAAPLRGPDIVASAEEGIASLIAAVGESSVGRVIYMSSMAVLDFWNRKSRRPLDEQSDLEPHPQQRGAATISKLAAEKAVVSLIEEGTGTQDWTILRPSLIVGGGRSPVTPLGIQVGKTVFSLGSGGRQLRLVHVDDVAEAIISVIQTPSTKGELYTVSHPQPTTARRYVREYLRESGFAGRVVHVPYFVAATAAFFLNALWRIRGRGPAVTRRQLRYVFSDRPVSSEKLVASTGWRPAAAIEQQLLAETADDAGEPATSDPAVQT